MIYYGISISIIIIIYFLLDFLDNLRFNNQIGVKNARKHPFNKDLLKGINKPYLYGNV